MLQVIKGRTRYKESPRIQETENVEKPELLYQDLKNIVLCVDFQYFNGVIVFHSISRKVDYRTILFPLSTVSGKKKPFKNQEIRKATD